MTLGLTQIVPVVPEKKQVRPYLALPASPAGRQNNPSVLLWALNTDIFKEQKWELFTGSGLFLRLSLGCGFIASGGSWARLDPVGHKFVFQVSLSEGGSPSEHLRFCTYDLLALPPSICVFFVLLTYCPCSLVSGLVVFIKDVGPNCDLLSVYNFFFNGFLVPS